jgi:hypothetical protein
MTFVDSITRQASRLATDVQQSLRRARLEGERRVLQRQHRTALEDLGERTYELVKAGRVPVEELGPEVAAVEARLMEIEAKVAELDALRDEESEEGPAAPAESPASDADVAFPMLRDDPREGARPPAAEAGGEPPAGGPGPGWEAANRFFKP